MSEETKVMHEIMLAASKLGGWLLRNNVALAAAGRIEWIKRTKTVTVHPGDAVVRSARPLHAGLCKGSSDLIGPQPVLITAEMVGQTIAVFAAIEVKDGARLQKEQANFIDQVNKLGGIAGVAKSVTDAEALLGKYS